MPFSAPGTSATASIFGSLVCIIPGYSGTVGKKAAAVLSGNADTAAVQMLSEAQQYVWGNTAAISRVKLSIASGAGQKFVQGSRLIIWAI